jgi:hypothetical protein
MNTHKTDERHPERATAAEDAIDAAAGVPAKRTADEQKRFDGLSPIEQQADDEKRNVAARAIARTKAIAALPKRTEDEQKAYDAMSPAERTADDDKRLAAAKLAAIESPEGRAAREAHDQAMAGNPVADKKPSSPTTR